MKRLIFYSFLILLVSCGKQPTKQDTLFLSVISDPKTFNELLAKETSSTAAIGFLFEGLIETDGVTQEIKPLLAHTWTTSEDGKVYTFYLREGVYWFDGVPLTAHDVCFTFNDLIYNPDYKGLFSATSIFMIKGEKINFEALSDHVVVARLPYPFAPFLRSMAQPILPKHILYDAIKNKTFQQMWGVDTPPKKLIGTGPYMMIEYHPGERLVYERNPNYWKKGAPRIERIVTYIVENQDIEITLFEAGELDILGFSGKHYARLSKKMKERGDFAIHDCGPTFDTSFIVFNQNPAFLESPLVGVFRDINFRRAIAHAIDKETIIKNVYYKKAYPQWAAMSAAAKTFHNPNVKEYRYDIELAKSLLDEAGYKDRDGDGIRETKAGHPIKFVLLTNAENVIRKEIGTIIMNDLRRIGLDVTFSPIDFNTLVRRLTETGDWECVLIGLTGGIEPHFGKNVWEIEGPLHMWNLNPMLHKEVHEMTKIEREKYRLWRDSLRDWEYEIDRIFDEAAVVVAEEKRRELYHRWQKLVADNLPLIYTVNPASLYAIKLRVKNVKPTAYGGALHNLEELYLSM